MAMVVVLVNFPRPDPLCLPRLQVSLYNYPAAARSLPSSDLHRKERQRGRAAGVFFDKSLGLGSLHRRRDFFLLTFSSDSFVSSLFELLDVLITTDAEPALATPVVCPRALHIWPANCS